MASIFGRAIIVPKTNKSGGALAKGDVVIVDASNDNAVTTTTTGAYTGIVGVVVEENGIANNATGRVQFGGHVSLVTPNASVTRGHYALTHTVAKQATDGGASRVTGAFGVFTTGGTTPEADLFVVPDGSGTAAAGTLTTVKDEGSNLSTAVISMDFVGAGVTATGTTAVTVTVPGLTRSTLGTTSAGASFDTSRSTYVKKITLATDGLLASIHVFIKGNGTNSFNVSPVLFADSGGSPTNHLLAPYPHFTATSVVDLQSVIMNTTTRDLSMGVGRWLTAGDYWIGVHTTSATGSLPSIAYTASSGSDKTNATGDAIAKDSSVGSFSSTTNDFSIYADIIR